MSEQIHEHRDRTDAGHHEAAEAARHALLQSREAGVETRLLFEEAQFHPLLQLDQAGIGLPEAGIHPRLQFAQIRFRHQGVGDDSGQRPGVPGGLLTLRPASRRCRAYSSVSIAMAIQSSLAILFAEAVEESYVAGDTLLPGEIASVPTLIVSSAPEGLA